MPAVTFVSTNAGKYREARSLLAAYGVDVRWKKRTLPEPQADTLEEVVRSKLEAVRDVPGYVLVEDSGLFIPSLQGFPGVYSAHIYGIWGFDPLFDLLRTRPREASFRAVAGLRNGPQISMFSGEVRGRIAPRPLGTQGFGFDPIFIPDGERRTFAQMAPSEKNEISHRSRALRALGEKLARAEDARTPSKRTSSR